MEIDTRVTKTMTLISCRKKQNKKVKEISVALTLFNRKNRKGPFNQVYIARLLKSDVAYYYIFLFFYLL